MIVDIKLSESFYKKEVNPDVRISNSIKDYGVRTFFINMNDNSIKIHDTNSVYDNLDA